MPKVLGIVLAGGEGKRLMPLTLDRAKPAVPFGGSYRLIDFALSNLVNAGYLQCAVLTQYKSHSLDRHISVTWRMSTLLGNYVTPVPAQQRRGPQWYLGSADAIYQSMNLINDARPDIIVVFGADHVYRMDASQMVEAHVESGAGVTVAGIRVPRKEAWQFGVIKTGRRRRHDRRVPREAGRPARARRLPRRGRSPRWATTSSAPTCWSRRSRRTPPTRTPGTTWAATSSRCWSSSSRPASTTSRTTSCRARPTADRDYWRDVGTLDSYHEAHLDLVSVEPVFNLYNTDWPIFTSHPQLPGAKFVENAFARDTIVCGGSIVSGANVDSSVIGSNVYVGAGAKVERSVIFDNVTIGRGAIVRNAILDKNVIVPDGMVIGVDHDEDRRRGFTVSDERRRRAGQGPAGHPLSGQPRSSRSRFA